MTPARGLAAALAICAALLASCGREPVRLLLVGDSITAGLVSEPVGPPFGDRLAAGLGSGYEVVNVACGGTSSLDWTRSRGARMCGGDFMDPNLYEASVRPALPVALAVVMLGTNDAFGVKEKAPVEPDAYRAAVREIVVNLRADGVPRVMLMTPPLAASRLQAGYRTIDYRTAVLEICAEVEGAVCGPDVLRILESDDFAQGNRHPNGAGHEKIANALRDAIRALGPLG